MRRESGFTLLEVLVTLTVLAVGAALTMSLISGSLGNIRKLRTRAHTVELAQSVMELALADDSVKGATTLNGSFDDGTRWTVVIGEVEMPLPPAVLQGVQAAQLPYKVLAYTAEVAGPESVDPLFRLQTLKVVNIADQTGQARGAR